MFTNITIPEFWFLLSSRTSPDRDEPCRCPFYRHREDFQHHTSPKTAGVPGTVKSNEKDPKAKNELPLGNNQTAAGTIREPELASSSKMPVQPALPFGCLVLEGI